MLDELFIALSLAANAANPAHLPDVITQEESYGQYFFYVAADKAHGIDQFSTDKINAQTLKVRFTVDLSFHPDTRKVALAESPLVRTGRAGSLQQSIMQGCQPH